MPNTPPDPFDPALEPHSAPPRKPRRWRPLRWLFTWTLGWLWWGLWRGAVLMFAVIVAFAIFNPPSTLTIWQNSAAYPIAPRKWTPIEAISPAMTRATVAAEDANFCAHHGFDLVQIRRAVAEGGRGGASTISQQTVKNVFLWQGRSWLRKGLEAALTPVVEVVWTKQRILEVYLNVAEFGPGVFGIHAAAKHHFGTTPDRLSDVQAARLATVLPNPKHRSTQSATPRSRAIAAGAATIARDGRDACFRTSP